MKKHGTRVYPASSRILKKNIYTKGIGPWSVFELIYSDPLIVFEENDHYRQKEIVSKRALGLGGGWGQIKNLPIWEDN